MFSNPTLEGAPRSTLHVVVHPNFLPHRHDQISNNTAKEPLQQQRTATRATTGTAPTGTVRTATIAAAVKIEASTATTATRVTKHQKQHKQQTQQGSVLFAWQQVAMGSFRLFWNCKFVRTAAATARTTNATTAAKPKAVMASARTKPKETTTAAVTISVSCAETGAGGRVILGLVGMMPCLRGLWHGGKLLGALDIFCISGMVDGSDTSASSPAEININNSKKESSESAWDEVVPGGMGLGAVFGARR